MLWLRGLGAGLAGGVAWIAGMLVFFGPAQAILADPAIQSEKFLSVFTTVEPLPHMVARPWVVPLGLLGIGLLYGLVYAKIGPALASSTFRRGSAFGLVAWVLMVPWFEFYLPWNVMHEPLALLLLEAVCWLLVLQGVGLAIAYVFAWLTRRAAP